MVATTFPLERIAEAQTEFLEKRHVGKYVLVPPSARSTSPALTRPRAARRVTRRARRIRAGVVEHRLGGALGVEPRAVVRDLPVDRRLVPAQRRRHEPGDVLDGLAAAVRRLEGDVRPARQHVVDVKRRLVQHGEADLCRQVRRRRRQRCGQ